MLASLGWTTAGNMESGDLNPGSGLSTGNKTVPAAVDADKGNIAGLQVLPAMANHPVGGNVVTWWIALFVLYLVYRYMTRNMKEDKLKLVEIGETTVEVIIGLSVVKWGFSLIQIPGITPLVLSA